MLKSDKHNYVTLKNICGKYSATFYSLNAVDILILTVLWVNITQTSLSSNS